MVLWIKPQRTYAKVFSLSLIRNVAIFRQGTADLLIRSCMVMLCALVLRADTPYQAECGVLSVVYLPRVCHNL